MVQDSLLWVANNPGMQQIAVVVQAILVIVGFVIAKLSKKG